ncbi:YraN family protein [uncultured Bartonella sp.]|uniref:YraN family protein n=1 Tax=uncultured Bartonella sp. TaxID=104108 RepID=UPI0025F62ABB|nr:YraN family protein [uncultured Bartonella sp.]
MTGNHKRKTFLRGLYAERSAALWLQLKGYHIAARRFDTRYGEIDLIARRGNTIAIVEVKARPTLAQAMEAVKKTSQRRIEAAATVWLCRQPDRKKLRLRFDLVAICPWKLPRHIPAFFVAEDF